MNTIYHIDPVTGVEFKIVRDPNAGGWLQGRIDASYADLVAIFGKPTHHGSGGKVHCEWDLRINGVNVSIYDWKEDKVPERVRDWHVGGTSLEAFRLVDGVLAAWKKKKVT